MQDLIFAVLTIAFFALSLGYVHFCDRLKQMEKK
jgi:cbb3-type cytochrome oxidase subunit 3